MVHTGCHPAREASGKRWARTPMHCGMRENVLAFPAVSS